MGIQIRCNVCGAVGEVPHDRAGQEGRCRCGNTVAVPSVVIAHAAVQQPTGQTPQPYHPPRPRVAGASTTAERPRDHTHGMTLSRSRLAAQAFAASRADMPMPGVVLVVRILDLVCVVVGCVILSLVLLASADEPEALLVFVPLVLAAMALPTWTYWAVGKGLPSGWVVTLVMLIIGLTGFPIGTILNGLILYYWVQPETKQWFGMT